MSKYCNLIYEKIKKTALKRVMIKCDPCLSNVLDFSCVSSYEGYILEEDCESISVMVIKQGMPTISIPCQNSNILSPIEEPNVNPSKLKDFKKYISKLFKSGDPLFDMIQKCQTIEEVENNLLQNNVTPDNYLRILRKFIDGKLLIEQIEAPGFLSNVGQFAKNAATSGANALLNPGETAGKINNLANNLKQGNYGNIASTVNNAWNEAREQQVKQSIKKYEWPRGYPKVGENVKIINQNKNTINNKFIQLTNVVKSNKINTYYGNVLGGASALGALGIIFSQQDDTTSDHSVTAKFTEGQSVSKTINTNSVQGDPYILQYNSLGNYFELIDDALGMGSKDGHFKQLTVRCNKDDKVGQVVNNLLTLARLGSLAANQRIRGKLVTAPEWNVNLKCWVAHATLV